MSANQKSKLKLKLLKETVDFLIAVNRLDEGGTIVEVNRRMTKVESALIKLDRQYAH